MLYILACPKPFTGSVAVIQRNAITSWVHLQPRPDITLFGDEPGTAAICEELGLHHVPDVLRNERGTPLLSDVLAKGQRRAGKNGRIGFINADIILMEDFSRAIERLDALKADGLM